jgi:hypothetical protein
MELKKSENNEMENQFQTKKGERWDYCIHQCECEGKNNSDQVNT